MKTITPTKTSSLPSSTARIPQESIPPFLESLDTRPIYLKQGLTKKHIEALYMKAFRLYETGKVTDALTYFHLMLLLNSNDKRAWLGCAACFEIMKQYDPAIHCYLYASFVDRNDPMSLFRAFHCYLEINEKNYALQALEMAIQIADENNELYGELKKQALNIKNILIK